MSKRKILFVNGVQFGYFTNTYYHAIYLKPYFDVTYLCFDQNKPRIDENGINVIYVNGRNKLFRRLKFSRSVINRSGDFDIIAVSYYRSAYFIGLFSRSAFKILNIFTGNLSVNYVVRSFNNLVLYINSLFFDRITVLSENLAALLKLPGHKTYIVPGGGLAIGESPKIYNKIHLLYLGMLPKRNIELTIDGYRLFYDKYSSDINCHYDIIGKGDRKTEQTIRQHIIKNGLKDSVQFHGRVATNMLPPFFNNATIGVCFIPQTPYYDFQPPTKLFEYAFSGLINIATNTSENKLFITPVNGEICEDNAESFFFALERLYRSLHNFDEQKIRNSLFEYHWERIVNEKLLPVLKF
jgi:Glycosyl transferases group 1